MNIKGFYFKLLTVPVILCFATPAPAQNKQDKNEAKERFHKGLAFVDEGDYKKAIVEFKEAYKMYTVPAILYNMALCYDDMHQYTMAMKFYKKYLAEGKNISKQQMQAIDERIVTLESFLGTLKITCNVDGALVSVDGNEMGETPIHEIYLETGDHKVVIKKTFFKDYKETVTVISGKTMNLDTFLEVQPEEGTEGTTTAQTSSQEAGGPTGKGPPVEKKRLRPGSFWGLLATTLALGIGAGVTGGMNVANHAAFNDTDPADRDELKDMKDKGETYNALFLTFTALTGAAAAATIVVGVLTDFKKGKEIKKETPAVALVPSRDGCFLILSVPMGGSVW